MDILGSGLRASVMGFATLVIFTMGGPYVVRHNNLPLDVISLGLFVGILERRIYVGI
jgi:hypothetical protein